VIDHSYFHQSFTDLDRRARASLQRSPSPSSVVDAVTTHGLLGAGAGVAMPSRGDHHDLMTVTRGSGRTP
jgi:hypothetical protein